jgi:hypothetical protein
MWYEVAMRANSLSVVAVAVTMLASVACGPPKPAESASHGDEAAPPASGDSDTPPGVSSPPPAPPVAPAPAPGSGVPYDKEAVEIGLKRAARQVKGNCGGTKDEDGKATGPWGKTTVTVKLGHNGHSQGAAISAPFDGRPVGKCISQAFAIITYPPFAGADTTIEWEVEVVEPPAAAAPPPAKH